MPRRLRKPVVQTNPPANANTAAGERIIQVSNNSDTHPLGALISLRTNDDGSFTIHVYRADPGVNVVVHMDDQRVPAPEADLTEPALFGLMALFDNGSNLLGRLTPDIRVRLWAAIENPTQQTWTDASPIIINGDRIRTLWQAVCRHTGYPVQRRADGEPWPVLPSREQLIAAVAAELGT